MIDVTEVEWERELSMLVRDPPDFDAVLQSIEAELVTAGIAMELSP